jgi:uncharacterized iron-regulated membrane protein
VDTGCLTLDRASSAIVSAQDPSTGTLGDTVVQWQWPLHSGQVFGFAGRLLVFVLGLACPLLVTTGFIRWLQKERAKRTMGARGARRQSASSVAAAATPGV